MDIADYDAARALWDGTAGVRLRSWDDSREGIAQFLRRNPATNFVAVVGGGLVGTIMCGNDGRRGYIYHTTVHEKHRNQGIAKALVERVCASLRQENITKVALVVIDDNAAGNAFWEKIGFAQRHDLIYRDLLLKDCG